MSAILDYRTGPLELAVELGIGGQANAGRWDAASWGTTDVWANSDTTLGDWLDVTCDVVSVGLTAGADASDGIVTDINATTGGLVMHGEQWNPWAAPWLNVLGPGVAARIRWRRPADPAWQTVFTGITDGWNYERSSHLASVPIVDPTGQLAAVKLPTLTTPVGAGDTITARLNRILTAAGWDPARRDIPTDRAVSCLPTVYGEDAWTMLDTAADTDLGIVWCTRTGNVAYRPVGQAGQWTPAPPTVTLTDDDAATPGGLCVADYTRADPRVIRNDVTIARAVNPAVAGDTPVPASASDPASIGRYGRRSYERTDLIHAADAWSGTLAQAILAGAAYPVPHPETALLDIRTDTRVADLLLAGEVASTIRAHDTGRDYLCVLVGYSVDLDRDNLSGGVVLQDVTQWQAGRWDTARWTATDRWGV